MKIAIQGGLGSFHHEAARRLAPDSEIAPRPNFAAVFQAVLRGDNEYGLCAVENNIHGSINEVYRLLERHNVWVVRDVRLHIAQQLIGLQVVTIEELAVANDVRVLSQAPAFAQVELWLDAHLPKAVREETGDTALSVRGGTTRRPAQPGGRRCVRCRDIWRCHYCKGHSGRAR